jgi:hypothetical protein
METPQVGRHYKTLVLTCEMKYLRVCRRRRLIHDDTFAPADTEVAGDRNPKHAADVLSTSARNNPHRGSQITSRVSRFGFATMLRMRP